MILLVFVVRTLVQAALWPQPVHQVPVLRAVLMA